MPVIEAKVVHKAQFVSEVQRVCRASTPTITPRDYRDLFDPAISTYATARQEFAMNATQTRGQVLKQTLDH